MEDFLEGGVFGGVIEEDVKSTLKTCPLTNLTGECLFGDLDYDMKKSRYKSLSSRSTHCMWKHNQWLTQQSPKSVQKLIQKGIEYGPKWKKEQRDEQKLVAETVKHRIVENKRKKDERQIKSKERHPAALNAMFGVELASTKEELDTIFHGPKATERLKKQIRYRSLVKEQQVTLSGNKRALYDKLLSLITAPKQISTSDSESESGGGESSKFG